MFGYVKACKPELKISEYDTYKAIYCSLCRQLGKDYGVFAKFILSYDYTFLAMLRLSIQNECCGYTKIRCPFNPTKKCVMLDKESEELSYTSACLIIMFYYKLLDNIKDNGFWSKLGSYIIYPIFSHYRKKALKNYSSVDDVVGSLMKKQATIEQENSKSLDISCEPTAKMLENIFSRNVDSDLTKRVLKRMGYCAGKWIYIIDALDDLDDDIKVGSFNPIANKYNLTSNSDKTQAEENVKMLLNHCNVELANSFELLNLKRYNTILANIIYLGMPDVLKNISNKEIKNEKSL